MTTGRLQGKSALVTGAGSGVGNAVARLFAQEGARVAAVARREEHLRQWDDVENVVPVRADLRDPDDIARMVDEAEESLGGIDIVCNIAGIHDLLFPLHETSDEMWESVINTDLRAPFLVSRRAITGMMDRKKGVILNFGSLASVRGLHGPSYNSAKAGLIGLTTSIAVQYAEYGIRCNLIQSGGVRNTGIGESSGESDLGIHPHGLKIFRGITSNYPVEWTCDADEVAPTVLFLCSDESRHLNGAIIPLDGGMSAC